MPGSRKEELGRQTWLELERLGIVERCPPEEATTWSSSLHLVQKVDGTLRACGDYRGFNDRTTLEQLPAAEHEDIFCKIGGNSNFFKN